MTSALIPLPLIVSRALDELIGARTAGPLLLSNYGNRLDRKGAARIVKRVAAQAHIPHQISPHSLRHTMVTTMLDAGIDVRDVQIAARHTAVATAHAKADDEAGRAPALYQEAIDAGWTAAEPAGAGIKAPAPPRKRGASVVRGALDVLPANVLPVPTERTRRALPRATRLSSVKAGRTGP